MIPEPIARWNQRIYDCLRSGAAPTGAVSVAVFPMSLNRQAAEHQTLSFQVSDLAGILFCAASKHSFFWSDISAILTQRSVSEASISQN